MFMIQKQNDDNDDDDDYFNDTNMVIFDSGRHVFNEADTHCDINWH